VPDHADLAQCEPNEQPRDIELDQRGDCARNAMTRPRAAATARNTISIGERQPSPGCAIGGADNGSCEHRAQHGKQLKAVLAASTGGVRLPMGDQQDIRCETAEDGLLDLCDKVLDGTRGITVRCAAGCRRSGRAVRIGKQDDARSTGLTAIVHSISNVCACATWASKRRPRC